MGNKGDFEREIVGARNSCTDELIHWDFPTQKRISEKEKIFSEREKTPEVRGAWPDWFEATVIQITTCY